MGSEEGCVTRGAGWRSQRAAHHASTYMSVAESGCEVPSSTDVVS